jgi:glutathione S-transferase
MFAPVINRFETYVLSGHKTTLAYIQAMKSHPAWAAWAADAAHETWIVAADEV